MGPSPIIALNRAIAIAEIEGADRGLEEVHAIADGERLASYPFYFAALGELEFRRARYSDARNNFEAAQTLARNAMERHFFGRRLAACERGGAELAFFELFWDGALVAPDSICSGPVVVL
jgi:RNA polymerase sigma-70 factor (ECF subfamily)